MRFAYNAGATGLATILLACLANTCPGAITYQLLPQIALDDGWAFDGGFVTTDGTLGQIGANNFIDWSIGFTSPAGQYVIESENGTAELFGSSILIAIDDSAGSGLLGDFGEPLALVATANQLKIPTVTPSDQAISTLALIFSRNDDIPSSVWPGLAVHIVHIPDSQISDMESTGRMFDPAIEGAGIGRAGSSSFNVSKTNYVIASVTSVPEPSSSACTYFAIAGSTVFRRRRRS